MGLGDNYAGELGDGTTNDQFEPKRVLSGMMVLSPGFSDIDRSAYRVPILSLTQARIVGGYDDGTFRPESPVLRAQFAKMVVGAMGLDVHEGMTSPFTDLGPDDLGSLYPHEFVAAAYTNGVTEGIAPNTFAPWDDITRAQLVTMTVRAMQALRPGALSNPPSAYHGSLGGFDSTHAPAMRLAEYNHLLSGLSGFGSSWDPWRKATRGECAQVLWNARQK